MAQLQLVLVPQLDFQPQTRTPFQPNPSIHFCMQDGNPVNLRQARHGSLDGLFGADQPCVITENRRITVRVVWPGYIPWTFLNMGVFDNTYDANRYSYRLIVHRLAEIMEKFYQEVVSSSAYDGTNINPLWDLRNIDFDRLYLSGLRHVAKGSWQPVLHYRIN